MNNTQIIKTLAKKRTANFREDETRLLIQLWGSPQIQNKLNLTHRKAPVMRLIAANMQQRGFFRSPDEIKTRIRNLKCLYHRIKRTITSGSGIGTVDPDWPHFKAMDAILGDSSSKGQQRQIIKTDMDGNDGSFEIKQEIDINDDLDSWNDNDSMGSDYDDDMTPASMPEPAITLTTGPAKSLASNNHTINISSMGHNANQMQQTRTITCTPQQILPNTQQPNLTLPPSIPLPFLILNSLKPANAQVNNQQQGNNVNSNNDGQPPNKKKRESFDDFSFGPTLNQLLDVQRQILDIDKQRLDVEKQRLEFDRLVGSQLLTLVPMIGSLIQRLLFPQVEAAKQFDDIQMEEDMHDSNLDQPIVIPTQRSERDLSNAEDELEKNRNILRNLLNQGLKARMQKEQQEKEEAEAAQALENAEPVVLIDSEKETEEEEKDDEEKCDEEKDEEEEEKHESEGEVEKEKNEAEDNEEDNESCVLLINENSNNSNDEN